MKFFDDQKIDDAGRTGVVLQKIILFFAALTVIGGIFGLPLSIITVAVALGIFSLAFFGAYYRKSCMLKAYAIIRILELIFHFLLVAVAFVVFFFVVGVVVAGVTYENYYSEPMPIYYGKPMPMPMPMYYDGVDMPMQVPDMEMNNNMMMMKHKGQNQPTEPIYVDPIYINDPIVGEPVQEPGYVGGYAGGDVYYFYYGWNDYVNIDVYYDYVSQLTVGEIVAFTIIATVIVIASIVVSIVYYAFVIYTIVLSFRMVSQLKQTAAVYAAVGQKECQLETAQPFVYVVADPTNGNQPVLLQPVDPTLFQMQNLA